MNIHHKFTKLGVASAFRTNLFQNKLLHMFDHICVKLNLSLTKSYTIHFSVRKAAFSVKGSRFFSECRELQPFTLKRDIFIKI